MTLYTPFPAGESPFTAANANSRLQELEDAVLNFIANSSWAILVPFTQLAVETATIDLQNIPQTYKHLNLKLQIRTADVSGSLAINGLRFNGDSGATNYYNGYKQINGAVFSTADNNTADCGYIYSATSDPAFTPLAPTFTIHDIWIFDYTEASRIKYSLITSTALGNADSRAMYISRWNHVGAQAAITSLQIVTFVAGFIANSSYELYGIK